MIKPISAFATVSMIALLGVVSVTAPAQAAFEMRGQQLNEVTPPVAMGEQFPAPITSNGRFIPLKSPTAPQAAPMPTQSAADVMPVDSMPVTPVHSEMMAAPESAPVIAAPVTSAPVAVAPAPEMLTPAPVTMADTQPVAAAPLTPVAAPAIDGMPSAAQTGEVIYGFGADMNLALAMRQMVPSEYQVSYGTDVDMSQKITWEGGKPWKAVVDEALAPKGLMAITTGDVVMVSHRTAAAQDQADAMQHHTIVQTTTVETMNVETAPAATAVIEPTPSAASPAAHAQANSGMNAPTLFKNQQYVGQASLARTAGTVPVFTISRDGSIAPAAPTSTPAPAAETVAAAPAPVMQETAPAPAPVQTASLGEPVYDAPLSLTNAPDAYPSDVYASGGEMPVAEVIHMTPAQEAARTQIWQAQKGFLLRDVLKDWADRADVDMYWSTDYDYRLNSNSSYEGDFETAVAAILNNFSKIRPQPYGQLHRGGDKQDVLVVRTHDSDKPN